MRKAGKFESYKMEIEIPHHSRMSDLVKGLEGLGRSVIDASALETLLNNAIKSLFIFLPNGEKHYGEKDPELGHIYLCMFNNRSKTYAPSNCTNIEFVPSEFYKKETGNIFIQMKIGEIDFRKGKYFLDIRDPKVLVLDTKTVMNYLGLEEK